MCGNASGSRVFLTHDVADRQVIKIEMIKRLRIPPNPKRKICRRFHILLVLQWSVDHLVAVLTHLLSKLFKQSRNGNL